MAAEPGRRGKCRSIPCRRPRPEAVASGGHRTETAVQVAKWRDPTQVQLQWPGFPSGRIGAPCRRQPRVVSGTASGVQGADTREGGAGKFPRASYLQTSRLGRRRSWERRRKSELFGTLHGTDWTHIPRGRHEGEHGVSPGGGGAEGLQPDSWAVTGRTGREVARSEFLELRTELVSFPRL